MDGRRPTWQVDACPVWCSGGHAEHDHPDDRVHRAPALTVPVVTRRTSFSGDQITRSIEVGEFEVAISRVDGEGETWAYVGDGPAMSIDVTVESAARLAEALAGALARSR